MKKKALMKEFFTEIKKTLNRFMSICLIVMLGTAFFSGVKAAKPDMQQSADRFFDESHLMDIRVLSSLGLTDEDAESIRNIPGVASVLPTYTYDVLTEKDTSEYVLKLMAMPEGINQMTLTEGRAPEKSDECIADILLADRLGYQIGDQITIFSGDDTSIEDIVSEQTYTIVGIGKTAYYLNLTRESSKIGNGSVSAFLVIPSENFNLEAYTEIDVTVAGARELDCYTDAYDDLVSGIVDQIKAISGAQCQRRYDQVVADAMDAIGDAEAEVAEGEQELEDAKNELTDGWKALEDAEVEYQDGKKQIEDAKVELQNGNNQILSAKVELQNGRAQLESARQEIVAGTQQLSEAEDEYQKNKEALDSAKKDLESGEAELNSAKDALAAGEIQLQAAKQNLEDHRAELSGDPAALEAAEAEIAQQEQALILAGTQIQEQEAVLEAARQQAAEAETQLEAGRLEIEANREQLLAGQAALESNRQKLENAENEIRKNEQKIADASREIKENEQKLRDAKREIEENRKKLEDAQSEFDASYEENSKKIKDAKADIDQARKDLNDVKVPEWYVLDRSYIQTCVEYEQDSENIGNIGNVFPIIFFLVAALVSLTTMTRMVEEERVQIGTLKALGYSKTDIAAKYVCYAFFATLIGGVIGTLIGQITLPLIIMNAYKIAYNTLTDFVTPFHISYTIISLAAAVLSTTVATIAACYKELLSVPAELMRPASPKSGRRVFAERLTLIWKHLNFSHKAAVRNLFRYKKRLFMTIIGISGCMGLLLVGFGLKDSIMTIGERQYSALHIYQVDVSLTDHSDQIGRQAVLEHLLKDERVDEAMPVHSSTVDVCKDSQGRGKKSAYLFVPSELDKMQDFVVLQNRITHEHYALDEDQVIISEKLAMLLDVSEGDNIYIKTGDMNYQPVCVAHIVENYFYHYIYMSPELYEKVYGEAADFDHIYVINSEKNEDYESAFSEKYLSMKDVSGVSYVRTVAERIASMIRSMDAIVYVLIISAGLLAFVVLYNLNNINISERQRELATLKVLGFYDTEVSMYVFRENIMLTVLGAFFGIFFGIWLHRFVIKTAEVDMMMFGRQIYPRSYILSILLTIGFSVAVNLVMHWKMKKIDMIESLKSVE